MIAGEVEARNASKRMEYDCRGTSQFIVRRNQDVPRKDQIVIMDGVEQSSDVRFQRAQQL